MACGVPVIAPRRGTPAELVDVTGGGLLVEPDAVESLASGLLRLRREPELARELGHRGAAGSASTTRQRQWLIGPWRSTPVWRPGAPGAGAWGLGTGTSEGR